MGGGKSGSGKDGHGGGKGQEGSKEGRKEGRKRVYQYSIKEEGGQNWRRRKKLGRRHGRRIRGMGDIWGGQCYHSPHTFGNIIVC